MTPPRQQAPSRPKRLPAHRRGGLARRSRTRLFVVLMVFGLAFVLVGAKLASIQGLNSTRYQQVEAAQTVRSLPLPALRGSILASNGDELALSEMRATIYADPGEVTDVASEAAALAPVLKQPEAALAADLAEHTTYVVLASGASDSVSAAALKLGLAGIGSTDEPVRYYPAGDLAAPVIGALNDNGAVSGLELEYNRAMTGRPGKLVESVDPSGHPVPGSVTQDVPAVNGDDIVTTIDEPLQFQTEQALSQAITAAHGTGGTAIVESTKTGALLAVASLAANGTGGKPTEAPSSSAFSSVYEPGSVAKIVTVSGALTQGVITPTSQLVIPDGYLVAGTVFHDAEPHPTENLTITGILAQSSNIGATRIGQRMGAASLFHYEQAFGLTQRTDIDFPGESAGLVTPLAQFSGTTLPTLSFGEDDAFTPVQMVSAMNTIADGGVYVPPRLVTATVGPSGKEKPLAAPPPHRVVPASVARSVTSMLEQVVSSGTGLSAQVAGYAVAGKTGTANSLKATGGYDAAHYDSSFAGFFPAQDPAITMIVVVDHTALYGAEASAPAFSAIAKDALLDLDIPSDGPQPAPSVAAVPIIDGQPQVADLPQVAG
jgi:cell division protein FtsI (penicillin-binding protein 3)